jgi:hypothetical protein
VESPAAVKAHQVITIHYHHMQPGWRLPLNSCTLSSRQVDEVISGPGVKQSCEVGIVDSHQQLHHLPGVRLYASQGMQGNGRLLGGHRLVTLLIGEHLNHKKLLSNKSMTIREKIVAMETLAILPPLHNFRQRQFQCLWWRVVDRCHRRSLFGNWCRIGQNSRRPTEDTSSLSARWWSGTCAVPLGIGPDIHDRRIQSGQLLESDVSVELLAKACYEQLDLVIFRDGQIIARQCHELVAVVIDGAIP